MQRPDILRPVFLKGPSAAAGSLAGPGGASSPSRRRGEQQREVVLELQNVSKRFGGVQAIDDVSFPVYEGQILGLIGPNGAGKTTIFDIVSGFVEPGDGRVLLLGEDITFLGPDERARLGLQRSFQS